MNTPQLYPQWIKNIALELVEYPEIHPTDLLLLFTEYTHLKTHGGIRLWLWTFFLVKDYCTSCLSQLTNVRAEGFMDVPIKERAWACQVFKARGEQLLTVIANELNIISEQEIKENCGLELQVPGAEEEPPSGFYQRVCWVVKLLVQRRLTKTAAEFIPWSAKRHVRWTQDVFDQYILDEFELLEGIDFKDLVEFGARKRFTRWKVIVRRMVVGK